MKVYVVNVNNCEAYSDYYEGNVGVYATRKAALDAMEKSGFDRKTHRRKIPWVCAKQFPDWEEDGCYSQEEFRIEEWKVEG